MGAGDACFGNDDISAAGCRAVLAGGPYVAAAVNAAPECSLPE